MIDFETNSVVIPVTKEVLGHLIQSARTLIEAVTKPFIIAPGLIDHVDLRVPHQVHSAMAQAAGNLLIPEVRAEINKLYQEIVGGSQQEQSSQDQGHGEADQNPPTAESGGVDPVDSGSGGMQRGADQDDH